MILYIKNENTTTHSFWVETLGFVRGWDGYHLERSGLQVCGPKAEFGEPVATLPCNGCAGGSDPSLIQRVFISNVELPLLLNFISSDVRSAPTRFKSVTVRVRGETVVTSGLDFRSCLVSGFIGFQYLTEFGATIIRT